MINRLIYAAFLLAIQCYITASSPTPHMHLNCLASAILEGVNNKGKSLSLFRRGDDVHWGYEGKLGPAYWADLSPDFLTCRAGEHQSPLNFGKNTNLRTNEKPYIQWRDISNATIENNGHTIQINLGPGGYVKESESSDKKYELKQFHFHFPSEHHVEKQNYPGELHLVHRSNDGALLVIGIFLDISPRGNSPFISSFQNSISNATNVPFEIPVPNFRSIVRHIKNSPYLFKYIGSLTTPPCTEGVHWMVIEEPLPISFRQSNELDQSMPFNARFTVRISD